MTSAFTNTQKMSVARGNRAGPSNGASDEHSESGLRQPATSRYFVQPDSANPSRPRKRLSDNLERPEATTGPSLGGIDAEKGVTVTVGDHGRAKDGSSTDRGTVPRTISLPSDRASSKDRSSKISGSKRITRFTSKAGAHIDDDSDDDIDVGPHDRPAQLGQLGPPWKKPLVYPSTGKKRATVDFNDLGRLDDDEFLNDNLVGFFLRYLEHYLEQNKPDLAKRIYFFNSYFFERLTNSQKGKRGINHDAVQKWTKTVDIFTRDFVVVPVNENLHWYIAIICNLSNIPRKLADDEDEDEDEDEVENIAGNMSGQVSSSPLPKLVSDIPNGIDQHLSRRNTGTSHSFAELSISSDAEKTMSNMPLFAKRSFTEKGVTHLKMASARRKSVRHSLAKYDPSKPAIITFDSLGLSRTATRTALRQYIVEEGKTKRSLEIDGEQIKGMTAKGIPTQKNYSDCGLFLCAYMEKFVQDPYRFVREVLQREMVKEEDWNMLDSRELRGRLREMIMELHREQQREPTKSPIPDVGRILLRKAKVAMPAAELKDSLEILEDQPKPRKYERDFSPHDLESSSTKDGTELVLVASNGGASISISHSSPCENATQPHERTTSSPEDSVRPAAGAILADNDNTKPSPRRARSRHDDSSPTLVTSNVHGTTSRKVRSPDRDQRSESVSTDFLQTRSWEGVDQKDVTRASVIKTTTPDSWPGMRNGEVPETQDGAQEDVDDSEQEIIGGI